MTEYGLAVAEALLDVGRAGQAREQAAGYLAGHPDDARGLRLIARCYEATDDYPRMLDAAQAAVAADAQSYQGQILLASALIHLCRYPEAVEVTGQAIRLSPLGWRGHLLAGVALCARGRRRAGMNAVSRAVALAPHEPHTHYVQALLRHSAGNRLGAKRAYRRALWLQPGHAGAQRGLGHLALAAGRLVDAVGHFTGAAAAEPAAGGAGLMRAVLGVASLGLFTSWFLLFVLIFGMFPAAWMLAAAAAGGFALVAGRFWRRVPAGGRLLLRARITSPRLYVRLGAIVLCALTAFGIGAYDAGLDPDALDVDLWPQFGTAGAAFVGTMLAVLAADVVDRREAATDTAPDAPLQHATARLTWRTLSAGCVPAALLWVLSVDGAPWAVRAALGTALIAGYAAVLPRLRRTVLAEPDLPSAVLTRLQGPISLGAGAVLIYLPMAAYWPQPLPVPAEATIFAVVTTVALAYACRLPVSGARWLWRRVRPAAGRPAP